MRVCVYDLELNHPRGLVCHKTPPANQQTN